ncbi:MAG: pyruvate kinase [Planctomycetaceae bacterium]|nr:pyruvate kinase [Planctomycetaceae bacterium]
MPRRTKIVATLGPVTSTPEQLESILRAGVDVARINFSHGTAEEHIANVARFRAAADRVGKIAGVMADLPGPKLRVKMATARELAPGETVTFSLSHEPRHPDDLILTEPEILADVRPGQRMLLDDGRLQLEATSVGGGELKAMVVVGGTLKPNKGLNLPDTPLTIATITPRDRVALDVAARAGVDWVAVSFVRGPEAAADVRAACAAVGLKVPVLAKIERPEAVSRAKAIVAAFDAIMVARGDLGVEIPLERVPTVQKMLIAEARAAGKPVITATDMLDSMRENPRPTRAEASDVANAIFDGTDAVMLSGETAVGEYPVEAVKCMHRIAVETESHVHSSGAVAGTGYFHPEAGIDDPLTLGVCDLARDIGAAAIVTPTLSGRMARLIVRHRPKAQVVAVAPTDAIVRGLAMVWGIAGVRMSPTAPGTDRLAAAVQDAYRAGAVTAGELLVLVGGHPIEGGPHCPTVRIVRVGSGGESGEP